MKVERARRIDGHGLSLPSRRTWSWSSRDVLDGHAFEQMVLGGIEATLRAFRWNRCQGQRDARRAVTGGALAIHLDPEKYNYNGHIERNSVEGRQGRALGRRR